MTDWIDDIKTERDRGYNRPLYHSQHMAVNARYPGLTSKHCEQCGAEIDDCQTLCPDCWEEEAADE